jgi:alpha-galactosidase
MIRTLIVTLTVIFSAFCLDNGLGRTPPMGWNSWNHFGCNINETIIRETADLLVKTGLAAKGYKYLNIDDCWQIDRNLITG